MHDCRSAALPALLASPAMIAAVPCNRPNAASGDGDDGDEEQQQEGRVGATLPPIIIGNAAHLADINTVTGVQ